MPQNDSPQHVEDILDEAHVQAAIAPALEELRLFEARLGRAAEHYEQFAEMWESYLEGRPHQMVWTRSGPDERELRLRRRDPIPAELSVVLGEFLYQMRAALDNCLYAAAVITSGENPPPQASRLEWPIRESAAEWKSQRGRYSRLPDDLVRGLEAIQPYQAGCPSWNSLGILHDLARFDRHRAAKRLATYLVSVSIRFDPELIGLVEVATEGVIQDGDILVKIRVGEGVALNQDMFDLDVEFEVDVDDVALAPGPTGRVGRPWGALDKRLQSVHKAVVSYCDDVIAHAVSCAQAEGAGD